MRKIWIWILLAIPLVAVGGLSLAQELGSSDNYGLIEGDGGPGSDTTAIHDNVADEISAITEKLTPIAADLLIMEDSAAANAKRRVQIGNLMSGATGLIIQLRNESGSTISKGKLLSASGFASGRITVVLADKDDPAKRPAIAVTTASVPNLTDFDGLVSGSLDNFDTSSFSLTDQLVLGDDGNFSRPPPDQDPFTGEIQPVGSTVRISATVGIIQIEVAQGLQRMTADEGFGLTGVLGRGRKSGGALSRPGGLNLDVASGEGFVTDGADYRRVVWSAATLAIPANVSRFIFVDSAGTVTSAATAPDNDLNITVGSVRSDGTSIVFISEHSVLLEKRNAGIHLFIQEVIGPVTSSGGLGTINGVDGLKIDVDAAVFYIQENRHAISATAPITFTYWFRDGSGGFNFTTSQTQVDVTNFDDGSGTLAAMTAGKFKKDALYVAVFDSTVEFHLVYGQEQFDSQSEAEAGNLPVTAEELRLFSWRSSGVVILKAAASITSIVDERPFIGQLSTGTTAASDHGQLAGLGDDDHTQYQLRSEGPVIGPASSTTNAVPRYADTTGKTLLNSNVTIDASDALTVAGTLTVNGAQITMGNDTAVKFGPGSDMTMIHSTVQTPDSGLLLVGSESNCITIAQFVDQGTDFGNTSANPCIVWQAADATVTAKKAQIEHNGTDFTIVATTGNVIVDPALKMPEQASASAVTAGFGIVFVKNTAPSTLVFKDDTDVEIPLGIGYTLAWGANLGGADGEFARAWGRANGSFSAGLNENSEITVALPGTMQCFSWNTQSADATTIMKIIENQLVVETITLTGLTGSDCTLTETVVAGDQLAVEFDTGTQPDVGNYLLYVR